MPGLAGSAAHDSRARGFGTQQDAWRHPPHAPTPGFEDLDHKEWAMHLPLTVAVRINTVALHHISTASAALPLADMYAPPRLFGLETVSLYCQVDSNP